MSVADKTITRQSLWRLLSLLKPKRGKYLAGMACRAVLTTSERIFIAYLLKLVTDAMVAWNMAAFLNTLKLWVIFYACFTLVAPFVLYLWRSAVFEGSANIREAIFKHIQRLPLSYNELHHSGDALSILSNDAAAAEKGYQEDLYVLVEASFQAVIAAALMLWMNWELALLIVVSGLVPLVINALFARPLRKVSQEIQDRLGQVSERMSDLLAGFQVLRTFDLGDWILSRFSKANGDVLESSLHRVRLNASLAMGNEFASLFFFAPMIVGAYLVLIGRTTLGVYIMLVQLSNCINYLVYSLGGVISQVQSALAASDRIFTLLDAPVEPEQLSPAENAVYVQPEQVGAVVEFQEVSFGYNHDDQILNALSFSVGKGEFIGFAGPSGGGKSTIFKLLLGTYPARQGAIFVAGKPIHAYRLSDLRQLIAYVPQDAYLFAGTIQENIRCGRLDATQEEITIAAKAAFADDFICQFPDGYQTVVGERGARLSGGQRQRIAIARAFLKNAPILLLDEATSALDSDSEQVVQRALEVLMQGRTTLVIAHRFSTILRADRIYVIAGGAVVEQGKHERLMGLEGVYAGLYQKQFEVN